MSLDFSPQDSYTEATQSKMIEQAAFAGAQRALASFFGASQLENSTDWMDELPQRREENMASKQQFKITLPTGQSVWVSGFSVSEVFSNFAKRYGCLYNDKPAQPNKNIPTLQEFVDQTYRPSFIRGLKATTQISYEHYLKLNILPYFGSKKMDQISVADIQSFYDWMATDTPERKGRNEATIKRVRGLFSRIFEVAKEMKIVEDTPFKNKLLQIKAQKSGHHVALPDAEVSRIKTELPSIKNPEIRLYFALLVYTGMRREEIMGLRWENVDLKSGTAYVRCTVTYPGCNTPEIQEGAKTVRSIRPVLLPVSLVQIMQPLAKSSGFLFGGESPWCYSTLARHYRQGKKLLGISGFNNHDFRTTFGTQLKEMGLTSAQVADLMGHADTRMVETVYARTREEGIQKRRDDLERMNAIYINS